MQRLALAYDADRVCAWCGKPAPVVALVDEDGDPICAPCHALPGPVAPELIAPWDATVHALAQQ